MIRWYYAHPKTREQTGPFDEATVRAKYVAGELAPATLVWHEGLAEWVPAREAFGADPSPAPSGEAALPPQLCGWLAFDAWMLLLLSLPLLFAFLLGVPVLLAAVAVFRLRDTLLRMGGTTAEHLPLLRALRSAAAAVGWVSIAVLVLNIAFFLWATTLHLLSASPDGLLAPAREALSALFS